MALNGTTIPTTGYLVVTTCWCGIQFAIPSAMDHWHRQREQNNIFCPLGHSCVVRETESQRLRRQLGEEQGRATRLTHLLDQERAEHESTKASRAAFKGQLTKTKRRVAHGICPCCNRSFANVERHMRSQHPDYVDEAARNG